MKIPCIFLLFTLLASTMAMPTTDDVVPEDALVAQDGSCETLDGGEACHFPYMWKDKIFNKCIQNDWHTPWCGTRPPSNGNSWLDYAHCKDSCPSGTEDEGQPDNKDGSPTQTEMDDNEANAPAEHQETAIVEADTQTEEEVPTETHPPRCELKVCDVQFIHCGGNNGQGCDHTEALQLSSWGSGSKTWHDLQDLKVTNIWVAGNWARSHDNAHKYTCSVTLEDDDWEVFRNDRTYDCEGCSNRESGHSKWVNHVLGSDLKNDIKSATIKVHGGRVPDGCTFCDTGYEQIKGDTKGWGKINGKGGGEKVEDCDDCADYCNAEDTCLSYECSPTKKKCNLNTDAQPSKQKNYDDYFFCSKKA